jgi:hypothetical protein
MASYAAPPMARQETGEECFQRLQREAAQLDPQPIGTPEEIRRDALSTYKAWHKSRRRVSRTA